MMKKLSTSGRKILFFIFLLSYCFYYPAFAQQPKQELIPLSRIKGTVSIEKIGTRELLILITKQGNFSLIGEIVEKEIKPRKDLQNKEIILTGIELPQQKELRSTEYIRDSRGRYLGNRKTVFRYKIFEVVHLESVEEVKQGVKVPSTAAVEVKEEPITLKLAKLSLFHALKQPELNLRKIGGKVVSFNLALKAPIPTLEIEYKTKGERQSLVVIVPPDTKVIQIIDEQLMEFGPTAIKIGNKVDMWYEQKGDQSFARVITILDKNQ
ncbi:MAG: hypothetical protein U9R31_03985 [Candidatus Omnitrophota bacterium]|nr:hypothetical protein [Candidatus Omnitrophota bacterium]